MTTTLNPGRGKTAVAIQIANELGKQGKKVIIIASDFPRPVGDGRFEFNGVIYATLHAAMRAMSDARNAEPVAYTPKTETSREQVRRERREMQGR